MTHTGRAGGRLLLLGLLGLSALPVLLATLAYLVWRIVMPLWQPLFQGAVLLLAISVGAIRVFRVKNRLEIFQ